jgi:hypothetical protein
MREDQKRKERDKKRRQREKRSPEKIAQDNEQKASYRKTEKGREQHIQQQKRNRERKQEDKAALKSAMGRKKVHIRHINEARAGWKGAQEELDLLRLARWEQKVENLPNPGAKRDRGAEFAQVPVKLYNLAQEFKESNPQVVIRVLDQNLPMIRDRIGKLDVQDDLISNFTVELNKLDDERY